MKYLQKIIVLDTTRAANITDLTPALVQFALDSGIHSGQVLVYSRHTTAAIVINEKEYGLLNDIPLYLERLAPVTGDYQHDNIAMRLDCPSDEPKNAHAHLKALVLSTSQIIPILDGKLMLGRYQSVLLLDFDGRPKREVIFQASGEENET